MTEAIFYQLFLLVNQYLFGGAVAFEQVESWMPLIAGAVTAAACVLLISLPFVAVFCLLKSIFAGFWTRF